MIRSLVMISAIARVAAAEPAVWSSLPSATPTTGGVVRAAVGRAEVETTHELSVLWTVRGQLRVAPSVQLELGLTGEFADDFTMAGPLLAATWTRPLGSLRVAVRGAFAVAVPDELDMDSTASSLLVHDPLVAWAGAHTATLQGSLQGELDTMRWAVGAGVVRMMPREIARDLTLARIDAGFSGRFARRWTWVIEAGLLSDVLDEEFDEGTNVVPMWSAGVHRHFRAASIGVVTTGAWVGGSRDDMLGPSFLIDLRGPL